MVNIPPLLCTTPPPIDDDIEICTVINHFFIDDVVLNTEYEILPPSDVNYSMHLEKNVPQTYANAENSHFNERVSIDSNQSLNENNVEKRELCFKDQRINVETESSDYTSLRTLSKTPKTICKIRHSQGGNISGFYHAVSTQESLKLHNIDEQKMNSKEHSVVSHLLTYSEGCNICSKYDAIVVSNCENEDLACDSVRNQANMGMESLRMVSLSTDTEFVNPRKSYEEFCVNIHENVGVKKNFKSKSHTESSQMLVNRVGEEFGEFEEANKKKHLQSLEISSNVNSMDFNLYCNLNLESVLTMMFPHIPQEYSADILSAPFTNRTNFNRNKTTASKPLFNSTDCSANFRNQWKSSECHRGLVKSLGIDYQVRFGATEPRIMSTAEPSPMLLQFLNFKSCEEREANRNYYNTKNIKFDSNTDKTGSCKHELHINEQMEENFNGQMFKSKLPIFIDEVFEKKDVCINLFHNEPMQYIHQECLQPNRINNYINETVSVEILSPSTSKIESIRKLVNDTKDNYMDCIVLPFSTSKPTHKKTGFNKNTQFETDVVVSSSYTGVFKESHIYTPQKENDKVDISVTNENEMDAVGIMIDEKVVNKEYRDVEYCSELEIHAIEDGSNLYYQHKPSINFFKKVENYELDDDFTDFQSGPISSETFFPNNVTCSDYNKCDILKSLSFYSPNVMHKQILNTSLLADNNKKETQNSFSNLNKNGKRDNLTWIINEENKESNFDTTIGESHDLLINKLSPKNKLIKFGQFSECKIENYVNIDESGINDDSNGMQVTVTGTGVDEDWSEFFSVPPVSSPKIFRRQHKSAIITLDGDFQALFQDNQTNNVAHTTHTDDDWTDFISSNPSKPSVIDMPTMSLPLKMNSLCIPVSDTRQTSSTASTVENIQYNLPKYRSL